MSTIVFPGQGAQYRGMGSELFCEYRDLCAISDEILGYSIESLCTQDLHKQLNSTEFTQPALYVVNALSYYHYLRSNPKPVFFAGHSLGEYNALLAAGAFDFETGLKLVKKRGALMSQVSDGAMLAVIRSNEQQVESILKHHNLQTIDIANYNSPSQLVLSGTEADIKNAKSVFDSEKVFCIPLKVSGAFHSRHMRGLAREFEGYLNSFSFESLKIPVIANVTGLPYKNNQIKSLLLKQIYDSVQWTNTVRYLIAIKQSDIIELGPGKVLSKLNADIIKNSKPLIIEQSSTNEITQEPQVVPLDYRLGSQQFLSDYNLRYPYVAGSMCNGISSDKFVIKMAKSGFLAFLGSYGLSISEVKTLVNSCKSKLQHNQRFGINIHYGTGDVIYHQQLISLCLNLSVSCIEVSGFDNVTRDLVRYRAKGLSQINGEINIKNKILLKTAKPIIAEVFMQSAPLHLLDQLLAENLISDDEHKLSKQIPMADDICVEGDSGWKNSQTVTIIKLPEIIELRDKHMADYRLSNKIRIGCSGGLGTPQALAAVFALGADFVLTGSINQCTVESGMSDHVKNILQNITTDDTCNVPAGDMFESGAKVGVVRKNTFFPMRAQKLYDLYRLYDGWQYIEMETKQQIEKHFFKRSYESIFQEVKTTISIEELKQAEKNSKYKMELVFKWYFENSKQSALLGKDSEQKNHQIYCGPAMGAFNQWAAKGPYANWRNRHVDDMAISLLDSTKQFLQSYAEKNSMNSNHE